MSKIDPLLTTTEMAQLYNRSIRTINYWRHKEGIPSTGNGWGQNYTTRPFDRLTKSKVKIPIVDTTNWNSKEWLTEMYTNQKYGIKIIARMVNRSYFFVRRKLLYYEITLRSHYEATKPKNKCYSKEWLEDYYVFQNFPIEKVAKLAGVTPYTIYSWLSNFKIEIRDRYEAMAGERNPNYGNGKIYIKNAVHKAQAQPTINNEDAQGRSISPELQVQA
jgi:hypothetical protein